MGIRKRWLDIDVVEAARRRIRHAFELYDSLAVMFSGGKDSQAVLELALEVRRELGDDRPIKVAFVDEEFVSRHVLDFINNYGSREGVELHWFAVPMRSTRVILGTPMPVVQWDQQRRSEGRTAREFPKPEDIAGTLHSLPVEDPRTFVEHSSHPDGRPWNEFLTEALGLKGRSVLLMGVRAAESMLRYRAVTAKIHENWIANTSLDTLHMSRPIYDWSDNEVLKWLAENPGYWCHYYDLLNLSGAKIRVSSAINSETTSFAKLRAIDPECYEGCIRVFPDMAVQELYENDFDAEARALPYAFNADGSDCGMDLVEAFVIDTFGDTDKAEESRKALAACASYHAHSPDVYPPWLLLQYMNRGVWKRPPEPLVGPKAGKKNHFIRVKERLGV